MFNLIKRIRQFDAHLASTTTYKLIDSICNKLLVTAVICACLMLARQVILIKLALN